MSRGAIDVRAAAVSRRRRVGIFHLTLIACAALLVGLFVSAPANGEATRQGPTQRPVAQAAALSGTPASVAAEPIVGYVTPTATEVLLMRWFSRSHERRQSESTVRVEVLLMRWLLTEEAKPTLVSTTSNVDTVPPTASSPSAPSPSPPAPSAPAQVTVAATPEGGYGCAAALAYLEAHAAPGYQFECPGYADGHSGMTCDNDAVLCPGEKVIVIAVPCPVTYMNEASNSRVLSGLSDAPIDPYGEGCDD